MFIQLFQLNGNEKYLFIAIKVKFQTALRDFCIGTLQFLIIQIKKNCGFIKDGLRTHVFKLRKQV